GTPENAGYYAVTLDSDGELQLGAIAGTQPDAGDLSDVDSISITLGTIPAPTDGAVGGDVRLVEAKNGTLYAQVTNADSETGNGYYAVDLDYATGALTVDYAGGTVTVAGAPEGANASPLDAIDDALQQVDNL